MERLRVGIAGGSGYGGGELLRLLLFHPRVELAGVSAHDFEGKRVEEAHPNLRKVTDLRFISTEELVSDRELDCLFFALPHGMSQRWVPQIGEHTRVVDLGGDFRLRDAGTFQAYYGREHSCIGLSEDFVYGLPEVNRDLLRGARRVANPGCFATAVLLALYPLVREGWLREDVVVDAKTGSSGSGAKPAPNTHHPRRSNSFFAYKFFRHQHVPEVLGLFLRQKIPFPGRLLLQTHSAPMVRGIFATVYARLQEPKDCSQVGNLFLRYYGHQPFVRLVEGSPDVNWVRHTNYADLGWAVEEDQLIVFAAIDNLVKGAAGQALQNMNLMFGFPEEEGLVQVGVHP